MKVGELVLQLRTEEGKTQVQIAADGGVSLSTVQKMESGSPIEEFKLATIKRALSGIGKFDLTVEIQSKSTKKKWRIQV